MKHNFTYFFHEGACNMLSHGFMSFAAVGITVACLLIMGTFTLVAYNANENLEDLQKENAILAFVDEELPDDQARALQSKLENIEGVGDCTFVSRQAARDNYVARYDEEDLYSDLEASVFRHRFVLHLSNPDRMTEVVEELKRVPGIAKVRADDTITEGFATVRNVARGISMSMIAVLLVVSLFIISNTIKLTTFDRRDEIAVERMVGATNAFIRWPFVYEGILLGLMGALIAFVLQWLLYGAFTRGISDNDTLQLLRIVPFEEIWQPVVVVFTLAGLLIGVGGSLLAIRRFLKV